ncbi:MAG: NAD(P)/FAD-dependent oxidoreductase [Oscillospiraceae bacterium]|nr:NAD(P)/FAD-dependent oxidoreductase [Oscillospiraceae bacterium]MBQ7129421.1 NAD(P)/FAD-dependent oxidoreductase [Oscillospiraceae bacterium]
MEHFDILIIGAGAAGIAAAKAAFEAGCRSIAVADRKTAMGGVLLQCAHRGFGPELTGPEYTMQLLDGFPEAVVFFPETTVVSLDENKTAVLDSGKILSFQELILATGCREIPMGALPIAGTRPKGIYTAGQMQEMMNLHGHVPQGPAVILGSGDLGLVMAKQLAQAGIAVTLVEQKPHCGGMVRNRRCLREYPIKLICNATVTEVYGERELTGCCVAGQVRLPCRTLLIAAGLRPERQLIRDLEQMPWLQLCGNCNGVHPMVESVINEGKRTGITAWERIRGRV